MATSVPVVLFNANIVDVSVQVNNGPPILISATNGSILYIPQRASTNPLFTYGQSGPNILAPGPNTLHIAPTNVTQPVTFQLTLPGNQQFISLQIYVYWNTNLTVSWAVLDNGQMVATSLQNDGP